ncbi:hypothetical protein [Clostridium beijerinckii]|uniref:hypothetical protein n=1 Tax=Clostridium beijerinckii TaxID=1520 RepID=UPI00232B03F0|nr:hypothetical protein [Clostridium beijerinckii]
MNKEIKEKFKDNFDIALNGGASLLGDCLSNVLLAHVAPGIVTTYLSYKQKRTEKMIMSTLDEFKDRINKIEEQLKNMEGNEFDFVKNTAFPIMADFIIDEPQEEKIKFIVNGIESIVTYRITDEDLILTYFDVLHDLRVIDIKELLDINNFKSESNQVYVSSSQINESEAVRKHIYKKLEKYDLILVTRLIGEVEGDEFTISKNRAKISSFGKNFIRFITKLDD